MARSPSDANDTTPENTGVDRNLAVTMIMRNPDASMENVSDRATQICDVVAALPQSFTEEEEPSIEEYMAALLQRSRQGQSGEPERTIPLPAVTPRKPVEESVVAELVTPGQAANLPPVVPAPPPECRNAFSEMRQVANLSTRTTFHSQLGFRLVREMRWNGLVAVGSIVTSGVLMGLAPSAQSPIFYTAVAATVVAAAWVLKFCAAGRLLQCVNAEAAHDASVPTE